MKSYDHHLYCSQCCRLPLPVRSLTLLLMAYYCLSNPHPFFFILQRFGAAGLQLPGTGRFQQKLGQRRSLYLSSAKDRNKSQPMLPKFDHKDPALTQHSIFKVTELQAILVPAGKWELCGRCAPTRKSTAECGEVMPRLGPRCRGIYAHTRTRKHDIQHPQQKGLRYKHKS